MDRADVDAGGYLLLCLDAEVGEGDFSEKNAGMKRLTFPFVLRCGTNHIGSGQMKNDT